VHEHLRHADFFKNEQENKYLSMQKCFAFMNKWWKLYHTFNNFSMNEAIDVIISDLLGY